MPEPTSLEVKYGKAPLLDEGASSHEITSEGSLKDKYGAAPALDETAPHPENKLHQDYTQWAKDRITAEKNAPWLIQGPTPGDISDEFAKGALGAIGVDDLAITHAILSGTKGKDKADAFVREYRAERQAYEKDNSVSTGVESFLPQIPVYAGLAEGAGALSKTKYLAPLSKWAGSLVPSARTIGYASGATAGAGATYGELTGGYRDALKDAAIGGVLPWAFMPGLQGAFFGAVQGQAGAGEGHRMEGLKEGALSGGMSGAGLGLAGRLASPIARGVSSLVPDIRPALKETAGPWVAKVTQWLKDHPVGRWVSHQANFDESPELRHAWNLFTGRAPETPLTGPEKEMARRQAAAVHAGGDTPEGYRAEAAKRAEHGMEAPKLYQVSSPEVRAQFRHAASTHGAAQTTAQHEADAMAEHLRGRAVKHTRSMVGPGHDRSVAQQRAHLEKEGRVGSDEAYPIAYQGHTEWTPEIEETLSGPEAQTAMRQVEANASRNARVQNNPELRKQGAQQAKEIADIREYFSEKNRIEKENETLPDRISEWERTGGYSPEQVEKVYRDNRVKPGQAMEQTSFRRRAPSSGVYPSPRPEPQPMPPSPRISPGILDRTGRVVRERAAVLNRGGKGEAAKGYSELHKDFDHHLGIAEGKNPALKAARAQRAAYHARIDTLDEGKKLIDGPISNLRQHLVDHKDNPAVKEELRLVATEMLEEKMSGPGATRLQIDKVLDNQSLHEKLNLLLGKNKADNYLERLRILRDDLAKAHEIAGKTLPEPTELSEADAHLASLISQELQPKGTIKTALAALAHAGAIMTPREAEAMVALGHGDPQKIFEVIDKMPDGMLARAVRAGITGRMGAQSVEHRQSTDDPLGGDGQAADSTIPATNSGGATDEPPAIIEPAGSPPQ